MQILVTGYKGFIGSHLYRRLQELGHDVVGYDYDESHGCTPYVAVYDWVIHVGAISSTTERDVDKIFEYNYDFSIRLFRECHKYSVNMQYASSASVYGEPDSVPIPESARLDPISPYGQTKLMIETILHDYARAYDIPSICFRYFNAAGAEPKNRDLGQEPDATHIVARVLEASMRNKPFALNGDDYPTPDGSCIRDYVHVWDIAQAHIKGAEYLETARPDPAGHIFNLGTNKGISNLEIVNYVKNKYGLAKFSVTERREGDPAQLIADATRARETLHWIPEYSYLETIVTSAYFWYLTQQTRH